MNPFFVSENFSRMITYPLKLEEHLKFTYANARL